MFLTERTVQGEGKVFKVTDRKRQSRNSNSVCPPLKNYIRGHTEDPESICSEDRWQIFKVKFAS